MRTVNAPACSQFTSQSNGQSKAWILERDFPEEFGRIDRHLINVKPVDHSNLPPSYIEAICKALGFSGEEYKPRRLLRRQRDGRAPIDIDPEILPQYENCCRKAAETIEKEMPRDRHR